MTDAEVLSAIERGSVVAAAGCGKTQLIVDAVQPSSDGRSLILTHTNAGVEAIRRRLRRGGVSGSHVAVDTLDGWCLRYVNSYPQSSGGTSTKTDGGFDWDALRRAMLTFLQKPLAAKIVQASYTSVFVDEYQDCDEVQHAIIARVADLLPMRVLGDPLQAIFNFKDAVLPAWSDVEQVFPRKLTLDTPWRWRKTGACPDLGEWLVQARATILASGVLDLTDPRIKLVRTTWSNWRNVARTQCFELSDAHREGTIVTVVKWPGDSKDVAKMSGGRFQMIEAVEAKDGAQLLGTIEQASAAERPGLLLHFLPSVAIRVDEHVKQIRTALSGGGADTIYDGVLGDLLDVRSGGSALVIADALDGLTRLPNVAVYRRELVWAILDSLRDIGDVQAVGLGPALRRRRV